MDELQITGGGFPMLRKVFELICVDGKEHCDWWAAFAPWWDPWWVSAAHVVKMAIALLCCPTEDGRKCFLTQMGRTWGCTLGGGHLNWRILVVVSKPSDKDWVLTGHHLETQQHHLLPLRTLRTPKSFLLIFQNKQSGLSFRIYFSLTFKELEL